MGDAVNRRVMRLKAAVFLALAVSACGSVTHVAVDGGGGSGSMGSGGSIGGGGRGGSTGAAGIGGAGGAAQCPSNQTWCPGCTPGTGSCTLGVCAGIACPPPDAGGSLDSGQADALSGACAQATTLVDCDARVGCHPVFVDPQDCRCTSLGCCAHFSRCANGDLAQCTNTGIGCTIQTPYCEGPYVVGYSGVCYEGCVRASECAP